MSNADFEEWSQEALLEEIEIVKESLAAAEDASDFCLWLAERWGVDIEV